jgi:hypothetical protein
VLTYLEERFRASFDFSHLQELNRFEEALREGEGEIILIPTKYPIPAGEQMLESLTESFDPVKVFEMPTSARGVRETVYDGMEFLLEHDGGARVVLFCPYTMTNTHIQGSDLVPYTVLERQLADFTDRQFVYNISNLEYEEDAGSSIDEFLLGLTLSIGFDTQIDPAPLRRTSNWESLYIPFKSLFEAPAPLRQQYLDDLGIENLDLLDGLPEQSQRRVTEARFAQVYGEDAWQEEPTTKAPVVDRRLYRLTTRNPGCIDLYSTLLVERIVRRSTQYNSELEALSPIDLDRARLEEVQREFERLTNGESLSAGQPLEDIDVLEPFFGVLLSNLPADERQRFADTARTRFENYATQFESMDEDTATSILQNTICVFLQGVSEASLIGGEPETIFFDDTELWKGHFVDILESLPRARHQFEQYRALTPIGQALDHAIVQQERSQQRANIESQTVAFEDIDQFLSEWCEFVWTQVVEKRQIGEDIDTGDDALASTFATKYDEFSDLIVENYDKIEQDDQFIHLSNLLSPAEHTRILILVDSFGYTDYRMLQFTDRPSIEPDTVDIGYSNIPSYTPSAMTTFYTGLRPQETGIFARQVKKDQQSILMTRQVVTEADLDFVDSECANAFQLFQSPDYGDSGITMFSDAVCQNLRLEGIQYEGLDEFPKEFETTLRQELERYQQRPEAREAFESDFVIYIPEFDSFLHDELSISEFDNYYRKLVDFLANIVQRCKSIAEDVLTDRTEIIVTADHGGITREETELLESQSPDEFKNGLLTENVSCYQTVVNEDNDIIGIYPPDEAEIITTGSNKSASPYLASGAKFVYAWTDDDPSTLLSEFESTPGLDVMRPNQQGIFDTPHIGLVSRYNWKDQNSGAHGFHGGTSASEMVIPILRYEINNDK